MRSNARVLTVYGNILKLKADSVEFKPGQFVTIISGKSRTHLQNAFYWAYLIWIIEKGGLKNQGHFSAEALHLDLKAHFLSKKVLDEGQFKVVEVGSTTELDSKEFSDYIRNIDAFMLEFFGVDTTPFHDTYDKAKRRQA